MKSRPAQDRGSGRIRGNLVALGSAAVLTVYTAGYLRTRAAAERFADKSLERRPVPAAAVVAAAPPSVSPASAPLPTSVAPSAPKDDARSRRSAAPRESSSTARTAEPVTNTVAATPAPAQAEAATPVISAPAAVVSELAPPPPVSTTPAAPAQAEPTAMALAPAPAAAPKKFKDGTYYGWGTSRHGDIQAQVIIENGRIASANIAQCLTRYSCSRIAIVIPQVAQRQSAEVDFVSGATESTNAFYYAVIEALAKAK